MFQLFTKSKTIYVSALLAALTSCGHSNPEIQGGNSNPVRVKVKPAAAALSANSQDSYSGTIEAGNSTVVSFSVAGTISRIYVTEGQRVEKGQLIASVDGSSLKNANEIAEAALREARDAYSRMKKLHDADALPEMQWVAAQEKLKQAEAAAGISRTEMRDASIYAPMSGVVARKMADAGQTVAPGMPVAELMDVGTLKAKISVPESDMRQISNGATAIVMTGDGERSYKATLTEKGVAANALTRNYDLKFKIANPDDYLMPGMICNVAVDGMKPTAQSESTATIVLPPNAIVLDWNNTSYVWLKKDGVARRHKIDVGGVNSEGIIVTGGLAPTDSVIVEGQQKLSEGLKVVSIN